MVALVLDGLVGFPAGLSPTSFHLSPSSFHFSPKLGACGRVRGWLVSHFLSFVSQFFSFVSQAGCLWSGSRLACLPLPFICLPVLFFCLPVLVICLPRLGACGRVPGWLVSHFLSFVSHFFSFVSQAGCLWSGSRLACLPLPFICLPLLFICLPGWGLSPTSFHMSPTSFHLSPRVPGWLVSYFLSFVSHFFSFVSQAGCLWSGSRLACLPLPVICHPGSRLACLALAFICLLSFHFFVSQARCLWSGSRLSPTSFPTSFHLSPSSFHCLPGWVLVVGLAAGLSPTSFHLSPTSFHLSPTSFHLSPTSFHLSPRLGACGRVPACLPLPFPLLLICLPVLFIVSQAGCLWSGLRLACLPRRFICLPLLFTSFHLSPRLGACGRVPGWLVSHFLSFVSHFFSFVSQAGACLPLPFICLPLLFICLPGFPAGLSPTSCHLSPTSFHLSPSWVLVVGFPAGLSPTSGHLCPTSFHLSPRLGACGRVPGWLVSHFLSFVSGFPAGLSRTSFHLSPTSFHLSPFLSFLCLPGSVLVVGFPLVSHFLSHFFSFVSQFFSLSPRLGACGRVCGWLVSHVVSFVSHFFSFVSLLFICLPGWVLVVGFPAGLSPTSFHMSPTSFHFLSPRLGACGRVPGWLVSHLPFICLLSFHLFVSQARCLWSGSRLSPTSFPTSFHLSPSSFHCLPGWVLVVAGLRLACLPRRFICHICLPLLFIVYSFVFQVCRWWCPPFSDVDATCLFICLPALIQTSICLPVSGTCRVVSFLDRITGLCQIQMREEEA